MSRSNPQSQNPNPAVRWFEWKGALDAGHWQFYDKAKEESVIVPRDKFRFLYLDRTATVRGYNKKLNSGIFSNEVKDTTSEKLVVRFFQGRMIANGFWSEIKEQVMFRGGKFALNVYVAFKRGDKLEIGAIQMQGASLGAWIEFEKKNQKRIPSPSNPNEKVPEIFARAISVVDVQKGKTGTVEYLAPVFGVSELTKETNDEALELDKVLQEYFDEYFKRPKAAAAAAVESQPTSPATTQAEPEGPEDDDVPF